jgi:hypothetical protein
VRSLGKVVGVRLRLILLNILLCSPNKNVTTETTSERLIGE